MWKSFLALLVCFFYAVPTLQESLDYEIAYPERLHHRRHRRDLSTATEDGHEHSATFAIKAFKKDWVLDTKINEHLIPETVVVRQFQSDGSEVMTREAPEHCHYQGSIRGIEDSTVVLDTCSGLTGVIDDGTDTYHIEPHRSFADTGAHKIQSTKNMDQSRDHNPLCGVASNDIKSSVPLEPEKRISRVRRNIANVEEKYKSYLTTDETRYNEVLFVVDNGIYQAWKNDSKEVMKRVLALCNVQDAIYQRINIRIVMSAIDIWTNGDRMIRHVSAGVELDRFSAYRSKEIVGKIHHDNAHFLSHKSWPGAAGMALVGTMCGGGSFAINSWAFAFGSLIGPYVILAHEMGHNLNFPHDSGTCKCLSPKGCVMGSYPPPRVLGFSNCSLNALKRINDGCLYNVPTKAINSKCGNGIREGDEECDCGTPEMCKAKDLCCLPHDCRLKPEAMCSDLHHSCCKDCLFKRQGALCRAVKTDCDVPEHCTGDSRNCPADTSLQDGTPCNRTNKLLIGNTNWYTVVVREIQHIQARYVRINPQHWRSWICMRTELYGCTPDEVNPTTATALKPYNNYCIVPVNQTCVPHENTKLMFKWSSECNEDYMEFRLDANGTLWHQCSQRRVCPEHKNPGNGDLLMISSACKDEDSKFVRTPEKSLKHVKSGKCVHPIGAWPGEGRKLVLWNGCGLVRLQIWFIKPDCIYSLGIQKGKIADSQMTASSFRPADKPYYGRLHNNSYWCAKEQKKTEYLQIDLGKTMMITKVATQGRGNWYNWITGYHLYYSQDGQRWTGYSESGDKIHSNSYCYKGQCAETRHTQCRDLWGPATTKNAAKGCYDKLNTEAKGYGTCSPTSNTSCAAQDVLCGQIQCQSDNKNPVVDYGKTYNKIVLNSSHCSAAVLKTSTDAVGQGMVKDGTKCGEKKMCVDAKCKGFKEMNIKPCPSTNGVECSARGVCTSTRVCHCYEGYDPKTACEKVLPRQDGGLSNWTAWSNCNEGCGGGMQYRYRQCSNPYPKHGGKTCQGETKQEQQCNTDACPKVHSCRHLHVVTQENNMDLPDGIYMIYPRGFTNPPIKAYCDLSRDGGGWTLLVTSRTNTWTAQNVRLRNQDLPSLKNDYSLLQYADDIKNHLNVIGSTFEYRLEAQNLGHWGGVWKVDRTYTFTSTNNQQTNVNLVKKFDNWNYANSGVEKRMPWISGARLTTSSSANSNWWGTITADNPVYHPAPWMQGHLTERNPDTIWYWMREGPWKLPRSCMEIQMRALQTIVPRNDGVYTIQPPGKQPIKTYCDLTSRGGGWTLLVTSVTHTGWTADNVKSRNPDKPSLYADYSILDVADAIKDFDTSQDFFQYRIEADGHNQYGGIFDAPRDYTFTSTCDKQTNVRLVENFNNISKSASLATRMPRLGMSSDIFLSTGSTANDASGSIVYNDGSRDSPSYLPTLKPKPGVVRYWMRDGTRRSCFDIKMHGVRKSRTFKDDYYMIRLLNDSSYLPVFCDMKSDPGAFTLVVTSRHNNWTRAQVPARNIYRPSLDGDYSILKYADAIKNLSHNSTFKYKLDAHERGHWGGVWSAPQKYSFMATSSGQTQVTLLKKFDNWDWSWWQSVQNRMPWFNAHENTKKALLTTSSRTTSWPSGSIIWGDTEYNPAYWMRFGGMSHPGVIWYWVNEDDCDADRKPVDAGMSGWSSWGPCDKISTDGITHQRRNRTCNNPLPRCGGKPCNAADKTVEERACFSVAGAHSCRHLQMIANQTGKHLFDGIYRIYPHGLSKPPIMAYCDMSRDGGGWTLLVTSDTNTWTKDNVLLRNAESPSVTNDYSILKYADDIKNHVNVSGDKFEYRLEAHTRGHWGGIWEADRSYTFTATTNLQTGVKLVKKFDNWNYADTGIEKRMPWISGEILTTSVDANRNWWGTITAKSKSVHPAPWIYKTVAENPGTIWYWMREGTWQLPRSCMEIQKRRLLITTPLEDGMYTIQPPGKQPIKTYCDLTSRGGGWTLLVTSTSRSGWTADNVKSRNPDKPSLYADYSILDVADAIKDFDTSQDFFQYRIEADGENQYGGIFDAPRDYTFTSIDDKQTNVKLVENFNNISKSANIAVRMPRLGMSSDIFLSTGSTANDTSGSIVYNAGSRDSPSYLASLKPMPGVVRYWMREGTRRSCFDIKIHGVRQSRTYKDGYYMIRLLNDSNYLPVFCDMTSDPGAFTLVVTSRHNNWTRAQVPTRNIYRPSLDNDYSILKYADAIKNLSHNSTFKYKLDAHERGHWGGVWSAPQKYSFIATSSGQTQVTLLKKFNNWDWSWWQSVQNRMPWFNAHENTKKALLTTSSRTTYWPSGSIIWGDTEYNPAYWMRFGGMSHPGVIWYWVNEDDCDADRKPVDAGMLGWSSWGPCDKISTDGITHQQRSRTCNNPLPRCGGKPCNAADKTVEERACFSLAGAYSCRHLQMIANQTGKHLFDGIYRIYPHGLSKPPIMAYCDMSRDGGGWTLLVTSHTNTWTKDNVLLRNAESPSVTNDYSILKYADGIKNHVNVSGDKFEYRLEAYQQGHWGGIWEADRSYTFTATTNQQTGVKLVKKFDNWNYADTGIEKRMPWISGEILTTSVDANRNWWGTITAKSKLFHPAPWIYKTVTQSPGTIWYWMREALGNYQDLVQA